MAENISFYIFDDENNIIVFDTAPLIAGFDINKLNAHCFTTSEILNEVKNKNAREKVDIAIEMGRLKVVDAPIEYLEKIKINSKQSGDFKALSSSDQAILSLAVYLKESYLNEFQLPEMDVKIKLITDDFSLQNVARLIHIDTESFKTQGTEKFIQWEVYCPFCFQIYPANLLGKTCKICGGIIKRRPKKTK